MATSTYFSYLVQSSFVELYFMAVKI